MRRGGLRAPGCYDGDRVDSPDRYSRQERFAPLGIEGQRKLSTARVAIVGCGALGSYHAAALARAGAGPIIGSIMLIVLFYAQYAFINIDEPVVQALHPVNGTLLLILSFWLASRAFALLRRRPERRRTAGSE